MKISNFHTVYDKNNDDDGDDYDDCVLTIKKISSYKHIKNYVEYLRSKPELTKT